MELISIIISAATLALVIYILVRSGRDDGRADEMLRLQNAVSAIRQELGAALNDNSLKLTRLITESSAAMRQESADRISVGFADITARVEAQLKGGRDETGHALTVVNEALIKRLGESASQTEARMVSLEKNTSDSLTAINEVILKRLGESGLQTETRMVSLEKHTSDALTAINEAILKRLGESGLQTETRIVSLEKNTSESLNAINEVILKRLGESGLQTETRIISLEKRTAESLEAIRVNMDGRLMAIGKQVQDKLDQNIKEGFSHFEKVQEHLKRAEEQLMNVNALGCSINELNGLLKLPHLRGGFGEAALEALVNDFLPQSMYELQAQVVPGSAERVDLLVKLPGASLPIDSKFPREQVLPLFETSDAANLIDARKVLSRVIRDQAKDIAAKYIHPEHGTSDMAMIFLPSETLYYEVIRDGELWEALRKLKVYPVSPSTLAVTLNGLMLSYQYYTMAKGVEKTIEDIKKARRHFGHFTDKFEHIGKQLDGAKKAYETAQTHLGRYESSVVRLTGEHAGEIVDEKKELNELPFYDT